MAVVANIRFKRGSKTRLPASAPYGEPWFTVDSGELYIGTGDGTPLVNVTRVPVNLVFCFLNPFDGKLSPKLFVPYTKKASKLNISVDGDDGCSIELKLYVNEKSVRSFIANRGISAITVTEELMLNTDDVVHIEASKVNGVVNDVTVQLRAI